MLNISSLGRCLQVCRLWNKIACISNCLFLTHLNLTLCKEVTISGVIEILLACNRLTELNLSWSSICRYSPEEEICEHAKSAIPRCLRYNQGCHRPRAKNKQGCLKFILGST
ncbi:uncharacterized protein LOC144428326 [Styela clava]